MAPIAALRVKFSRDSHEKHQPRPGASDPVRHADGDRGYRHLVSRLPLAGVAAPRQRRRRVDRGRCHDAATGALHVGRRYRGRLFRAPPGFADLRFAVRHGGGGGPADRLVVRCGRDQRRRAGGAGFLLGRFRPGRGDGAPVDAARGRRPRRLVAGPHQQRLRGDSQPGLHRGPGHRRSDDRHGRRHQHDVDHGGLLRVVLPRDWCAAARGDRQAAPRDPTRRVGVRGRRRNAIRLEPAGAADARVDRPGRHRSVPADGKRAVSQILQRPSPTRAVGLGVDGARGRRRGGRARLRRHSRNTCGDARPC